MVTITGDNNVVAAGPQIMIYPGPLLPNLQARPITDAGFEKIVQRGRDLGMFTGSGDFTPPDVMPGASARAHRDRGRWRLSTTLTGDPSRVIVCITAPCDPAPGSPEAFGTFWASLSDLTWLAGDLGPEAPYVADLYALLIGVEPTDDPAIRPAVAIWPLEQPIATLGKPVGPSQAPRCGTVRGADAATLRPSLESANQLTRWVDEGADRAERLSRSARWCPARTSASRCSACPSRVPNMAVGAAALGAACAVFDPDGRVLLVRHTYDARNWELPGGGSQPGEDPRATARRELLEETGLDIEPGPMTGIYYEVAHEAGPFLHVVFRIDWLPGQTVPEP